MESIYEYLYLNKIPGILLAVVIFLISWLIAAGISRAVRSLLTRTTLDDKLFAFANIDSKYKPHVVISKIVYWILLIFAIILLFNMLGLQFVAEPIVNMMNTIAQSIPNLLKAALILLFGWIFASALNLLVQKGGQKAGLDRLLAKWGFIDSEEAAARALQNAGRIVFYLVLLLFLPGVLDALSIPAISEPMSGMLAGFLEFLPKLFAAALILLIGWFAAKIVREILTKFLQSIGVDRFSETLGLNNVLSKTPLSSVIGNIVYILILIPVFIAALEALDLRGISAPAIAMLTGVLTMIPNILVAVLLILIGVWLGRAVGHIVAQLLEKLGFNAILKHLGLEAYEPAPEKATASQIAGRVAQAIVILLFAVEALQVVKLQVLVTLTTAIIAYLPSLFVAIIIIGLGLFLGSFVQRIISGLTQKKFAVLSLIAKYAIITLSVFMALDQLGVADSIVSAAFILILGGLSLAFGLAFGLGGREVAASWLKKWQAPLESESDSEANP